VHSIPDTMELGDVNFDMSETKLKELIKPMVDKYNQL
jgi:hypothetical protein